MLGTLLDTLRETAQRSGLLDSCDATGYSVRPWAAPDGAFAVTSTAEPGLQASELLELAETLRADGYLVRLCGAGREPRLMVRADPHAS